MPTTQPTGRSRLGAAATTQSAAATTQSAAALPEISYPDQVLLLKAARRAFRARVTHSPERGPSYRPPALRGLAGIIHLTLRSHGVSLVEAESREMPVVDAAVAAGALLGQAALDKKLAVPDGGDGMGLEFELLGPRETLDAQFGDGATWADDLLHGFEPAVEGIGVAFRGREAWTRPSDVVSLNYTPDVALHAAESRIGLKHADKIRFAADIRYFRFQAFHLWQPSARVLPILLVRGGELIPPESVTPEALDAAIERMGAYLHYRQNSDGWFSQEYLPTPDRYGQGNSAVVQMRALAGLAEYGARSGRPDVIADAMKGIVKSARFLTPLREGSMSGDEVDQRAGPSSARSLRGGSGSGNEGQQEAVAPALVLWFPGHGSHLESSARLLMAMAAVSLEGVPDRVEPPAATPKRQNVKTSKRQDPEPAIRLHPFNPQSSISRRTFREQRSGLFEGVLALQDQNGGTGVSPVKTQDGGTAPKPVSSPADGDRRDSAGAGWALLALGRADPAHADERVERALHQALRHYRRQREALGPVASAAFARAFALGYARSNDARASEWVFEVLDRFVASQVTEDLCPWPELHGAINVREPGAIGVDTVLYLTALSDGLLLAERIGDKRRVARYRKAILSAARFVMQLEVREEHCYYIRSPRDAVGGVRTALWDNRIRVDYCAEALMGLMRARRVLYGGRGD